MEGKLLTIFRVAGEGDGPGSVAVSAMAAMVVAVVAGGAFLGDFRPGDGTHRTADESAGSVTDESAGSRSDGAADDGTAFSRSAGSHGRGREECEAEESEFQ